MKKFKELHKFFCEESKEYMRGESRFKYYIGWPVAYLKFMIYSYAI